ncbi:MAG: DinB family protein [Candidatus Krumholzibacteria bacterium]|nr:DinB family protein [Candidatus Krumholzibacteria bacterium]
MRLPRPAASDYDAFYRGYVARCLKSDILAELAAQIATAERLLRPLDDTAARYRYAPGKWSIKEVVGHLVDTERLFAYRATSIARNDRTELPGIDQDQWLAGADFDRLALSDLLDEFTHLRRATVLFCRGLSAESLARRGVANGKSITVLALPYIIAGHSGHHLEVIERKYR